MEGMLLLASFICSCVYIYIYRYIHMCGKKKSKRGGFKRSGTHSERMRSAQDIDKNTRRFTLVALERAPSPPHSSLSHSLSFSPRRSFSLFLSLIYRQAPRRGISEDILMSRTTPIRPRVDSTLILCFASALPPPFRSFVPACLHPTFHPPRSPHHFTPRPSSFVLSLARLPSTPLLRY